MSSWLSLLCDLDKSVEAEIHSLEATTDHSPCQDQIADNCLQVTSDNNERGGKRPGVDPGNSELCPNFMLEYSRSVTEKIDL